MLYAITTPQCVKSTYNNVDDVEEFIKNIKKQHPNVSLGKVDLWVLDWTPTGYSRNEYIILKGVTTEDLMTIRKILNPNYRIFKIRSSNTELVGYIDIIDNEVYLTDEHNRLQNIRTYYSDNEDYDSLRNICWEYRSNLKELVLKHNRISFHFGELFDWGVKDPKVDVEYQVIKSNLPSTIIGNPNNKMIIKFKNKVFVNCNHMSIKTDTIVENEKYLLIGDNIKINKYMVTTFKVER